MWKIELPYAPGEKVFIATRNHLGHWSTEQCTVSHYIIKSEKDISIALRTSASFSFRFHTLNDVFATEDAAKQYIKEVEGVKN